MAESKRKFYKTILKVTVLSEERIPGHCDLSMLAQESYDGEWVATFEEESVLELDGKKAAEALCAAGSEPGFFMLDDDGNDTEG